MAACIRLTRPLVAGLKVLCAGIHNSSAAFLSILSLEASPTTALISTATTTAGSTAAGRHRNTSGRHRNSSTLLLTLLLVLLLVLLTLPGGMKSLLALCERITRRRRRAWQRCRHEGIRRW